METLKWIMENFSAILAAIIGVIGALIVLFALIPGDQPEATLQKILDFLKKFSNKPRS